MGVDLGDLAIKHKITLDSLGGKIIAIDAYNVLYQFLASIRQEDGTPLMDYKGRVTAHLSGLFYRSSKLLENNIRPVYVFDGKPSDLKRRTHEERAAAKQAALEKWKKAVEEERLEDAKRFAQATSRLTPEMVAEAKKLLDGMGIPWVQAPSEGEAQAAAMVQQGIAYAAASQDYDAILFGAPVLVRNISITGKRKVPRQDRYIIIEPEEIRLTETLQAAGLDLEQLITIGILVGTDFNKGVKGVGPKTALKIVKEHKTFDEIIKYTVQKYGYTFEVEPEDVMEIFRKPKIMELAEKPVWKSMDEDQVREMLVKEHDFSEERISSVMSAVKERLKETGSQRKLDNWFG
ncbi:MAG: flap endonuclease-1 [Candidatus Micrarchaeota archaeon]